jgi:5-methylcytosine-specific restriction protein A
MPWVQDHPCTKAGCPALVPSGQSRCARHPYPVRVYPDTNRPSSQDRGYTARWQRARAWYLDTHPLCEQCQRERRLTTATVVDHIRPHRGDKTLFWDQSNWQSLCRRCHDRKTARERGNR